MIRLTSTYALRGDISRRKGNNTGGLFDNIGETGWTNYSGEYEAGKSISMT